MNIQILSILGCKKMFIKRIHFEQFCWKPRLILNIPIHPQAACEETMLCLDNLKFRLLKQV